MLSGQLLFKVGLLLLPASRYCVEVYHGSSHASCLQCRSPRARALLQVETVSRAARNSGSADPCTPRVPFHTSEPFVRGGIDVKVAGKITVAARSHRLQSIAHRLRAPIGTSNVASGAAVTCQEGVSCDAADRAGLINGVTGRAFWGGVPSTKLETCQKSKWVQLDLQAVYNVSKTTLFLSSEDCRTYCSLQLLISVDGTDWQTVFVNGPDVLWEVPTEGLAISFKPRPVQFVRWYSGRSDASSTVEFLEVQVFGQRVDDLNPVHPPLGNESLTHRTNGNSEYRDLDPPWYASFGPDALPKKDGPPEYNITKRPLVLVERS